MRLDHAHVELAGGGAAARLALAVGSPHRVGHEMQAQHRHAGARHGADRRLIVLDLLVAAFEPHHRLVVEMRGHVLDGLELETGFLRLAHQLAHVLFLPAALAGQGRVVHLQAGCADLPGKTQPLLGEFVELAHGDPDRHRRNILWC